MTGIVAEHRKRRDFALPAELADQGLDLRRQDDGDLPFLSDLYASMRWDELAPLTDWSDDQKRLFLADQFRLQHHHYTTHYEGADFLIVEERGVPIGRLYLDRVLSSDLRIVDVGFLPAHRNKGYGTALLHAILREAAASGKIASIHVEGMNPARRLYRRLGFREISEAGPYWLMEWRPVS